MEHPNRGKRSIGLALDTPGGLEVLYDIVRGCDVFVTNFLPDARERLRHRRRAHPRGQPADHLRAGKRLRVAGPEAAKGGFDSSAFWSRGGGAVGVTPTDADVVLGMPAPAFGDSIGGMTIAGGIAGALFARERTGETSIIDVSLLSTAAWASGLAVDIVAAVGRAARGPDARRRIVRDVQPDRRQHAHVRRALDQPHHAPAGPLLGRLLPAHRP